ncbi:DUF2500 domain-containing protein [Vitiosangium sp. GDMCC 1.1324]|uniref:DUF2500 domain-containing protein n=1 Tax=Vitiosangium sp. (strain GDMCC 1.1324) TaxID=2138576 RepID=UPI00130E7042|nr:DUF2500 domain-containing protein [Vitiosangium sp. GDMCC 1.1324]
MFVLVLLFCLLAYFRWMPIVRNLRSPVLSRPGRVVAKREQVSATRDWGTTVYFVTFEFPDGSREEFRVLPNVHGLLAEGDQGTLVSQGTWFKGFERQGLQRGND